MRKFDVLIIGAGSIGVPAAYYLAKKGLSVGVIEKLPSEGRGQNRAAIGGIRATHSDPAKIKICQLTIGLMNSFEKEHDIDIDWISGGYLFPVYDEVLENKLKKLLVTQKKFNLNIDWIDAGKVKELVPGINPENLRGGTFSPEDGSASPLKMTGAYLKLAKEQKAEFFFNEEVKGFRIENNKIIEVETNKDKYSADIIINAAGGDAKEIGLLSNLDIPVNPDCHEAGITEPVKPFFKPMVVDIRSDENSANYYFYQNKEGQVVFCITPKPSILGKDTDNTSVFLPLVVKRILNLYPRLRNLRIRRTWRGLYPMTPDGFPIVGWTKEVSNMFLAVGMCGQGFMLGPGLGQIISEIIVDKSDKYNFILDQLTLYREFAGIELLK
ncbi:MAG: FAD-binding oxidoreductase [Ignavibacteriae bacterium]|nr:FAD-binding oxidoreductase [Ignavibacteriota bacterium]